MRSTLIGLTALVAAWPLAADAGTWSGKDVTKDGVVHVMNPATPADGKQAVAPREVWRAGGYDDEAVIFGVIRDAAVDDAGNIYLLDVQLNQVHVFSPDGEFLRDIGREGEGPGEFRRPSGLFIMPDGRIAVSQFMPGRIILLNPDGSPGGDFSGPAAPDGGMQMYFETGRAGNSIILGVNEFQRGDNKFTTTRTLQLLDINGTPKATLDTQTVQRDMGKMSFDEKQARGPEWAASSDGRIFVSDNFDAYTIKRYNPAGQVEKVIAREYTHRKRSKAEMEENKPRVRFRTRGGSSHQPESTASPTDRDILQMYARDDGSLWVLSSHGALDPQKGAFFTLDVFDKDGRFVNQTALQVEGNFRKDGIEIAGDHLFVIRQLRSAERAMDADELDEPVDEDEDAEPMSIVCYRLTPGTTARK
jgi:hypothetical protein